MSIVMEVPKTGNTQHRQILPANSLLYINLTLNLHRCLNSSSIESNITFKMLAPKSFLVFALLLSITNSHPVRPRASHIESLPGTIHKLQLSNVPSKYYLINLAELAQDFTRDENESDEVLDNLTFDNCPMTVNLGAIENKDSELGLINAKDTSFDTHQCSTEEPLKLFNATFLQDSDFIKRNDLGNTWSQNTSIFSGLNSNAANVLMGLIPKSFTCGKNGTRFAGGTFWVQAQPNESASSSSPPTQRQEVGNSNPEMDFMSFLSGSSELHFLTLLTPLTSTPMMICHYTESQDLAAFMAQMLQALIEEQPSHDRPPMGRKNLADSFALIKRNDTKNCPVTVDVKPDVNSNIFKNDSSTSATIKPGDILVNGQRCKSDTSDETNSLIQIRFNISEVFDEVGVDENHRAGLTKTKGAIEREAKWQVKRERPSIAPETDVNDEEIQQFIQEVHAGAAFAGYIPQGLVCGSFRFREITPFVFINASPLDTFEIDYRQFMNRPEDSLFKATARLLSNNSLGKLQQLANVGQVPEEFEELLDDGEKTLTTLHLFVGRDESLCAYSNSSEYSKKLGSVETLIEAAPLALESSNGNNGSEANPDRQTNITPNNTTSPAPSQKPQGADKPSNSTAQNSTAPTSTPTTEPTTGAASTLTAANEFASCFPSNSMMDLEDGSRIQMSQLRVGDKVRVGPSSFEPVILFTHSNRKIISTFLQLTTADGTTLTLTSHHYVPTQSQRLVASMALRVGDNLILANGKKSAIINIKKVRLQGLYNPHTSSGQIVVDGILASTYTTAVHPATAHALMRPLRILNYYAGIRIGWLSTMLGNGSSFWTSLLPTGSLSYAQ